MRNFILLFSLTLLFSCGRKQEKESKDPNRSYSTPDYGSVELPDAYIENLKSWEQSFEKECSATHIFLGNMRSNSRYDFNQASSTFKKFLLNFQNQADNENIILVPHPDWEKLAADNESFTQTRYIRGIPVKTMMNQGHCHLYVNNKLIVKKKLLKTIPLLFSFDQSKIKSNNNYAPEYSFRDFKRISLARKALETDPLFANIKDLISMERLNYQAQTNGYCPPSESLFTLMKDDERDVGSRCLFGEQSFHLRTVGLNDDGNFLYQIEKDFKINEFSLPLQTAKYTRSEDVKEFEEKYWPHQFLIGEQIVYDYSLRVIHNCHLIVSLKEIFFSRIKNFDLLLGDNNTDLTLEAQSNNNLIIARIRNSSENLVLRYDSYKKAKRIFYDLLDLKKQCQ